MLVNNDHLGVNTFVASSHGNDQCGTNGLPLTPNSIVIMGRFHYLKTIEHPNLCRYIDIRKGTNERLLVVSEYYERNFECLIKEKQILTIEQIQQWTYQILNALIYLQEKKLHARNLSLKNIRLTQSDQIIKIQNYGLWHMTQYGTCVSFPIGDPYYLAPECFPLDLTFKALMTASNSHFETEILDPANTKSCVWSFGIILLELCLGQRLYENQSVTVPMSKSIRCLTLNVRSALDILLQQNTIDREECLKRNSTQFFLPIIRKCLNVQVQDRPTFAELLNELGGKPYASPIQYSLQLTLFNGITPVLDHNLDLNDFKNLDFSSFRCRTIDQVYYLWRLAGGDLITVLKNAGLIKISPSISKISKFVTDHGEVYGLQRDVNTLFDNTSYKLSLKELENRFNEMPIEILHPLLEGGDPEFDKRQDEFDKMIERHH
jgi:TBC domain-containing protein kinase-like protein